MAQDNTDNNDEPLQWMYDGDKTDPEEYLLGKRIDSKTIAQQLSDDRPGSYTVDMANKIREDPLFIMKKRELEEAKKILQNPIRMKKLQQLLNTEQSDRANSKRRSPSSRKAEDGYNGKNSERARDGTRDRYQSNSRRCYRRSRSRHRPRSNSGKRETGAQKYSRQEAKMRLEEMLQNGQWREKQRRENTDRERKRMAVEEDLDRRSRMRHSGPSRSLGGSYNSVADNIRRNPQRYRKVDD